MTKTVKISGTNYKVQMNVPMSKDEELRSRFGYCSCTDHRIVVADLNSIESWKNESEEAKRKQTESTLRHEVIPAFLAESGLWGSSASTESWALNEEMVDWFVMQLPKMMKVFEQLGCMGV